MRKALIYTVDENELDIALFSAARAAEKSDPRDFDIIIASLDPVHIPDEFRALGIENRVLNLRDTLNRESFPLKHLPIVAYLRLWLPNVFADRYDSILYLDADTYPCTSAISQLFEIDIGPHVLGAVLDVEQWRSPDTPVYDFAALGLPCTRYFNSGLVLFDVSRCNAQDLLGQMLKIHRSGTPLLQHDQSLLNLAVEGNFAELSPRWNWQWAHRFPLYTRAARPLIQHFPGTTKPWRAHVEKTRYPRAIISEYQRFLSDHGSRLAFETERPGGLREPLLDQLDNIASHVKYRKAYLRLMRQHQNPFKPRL